MSLLESHFLLRFIRIYVVSVGKVLVSCPYRQFFLFFLSIASEPRLFKKILFCYWIKCEQCLAYAVLQFDYLDSRSAKEKSCHQ